MFSSRNILDFYFLEAMMDRAKRLAKVPLPSQERWRADLGRLYEPFVKGFAASVRDYLFLVCMGEARHGYNYGEAHFPKLGNAHSRKEAYRQSTRYNPEKNVAQLADLFNDYGWFEDGYGSTPWGTIATAIKLYGQVPDVVFIDLVVSIEHNNGCVFDKTEVSTIIAFKCNMWVYEVLRGFLEHKAQQDILSHPEKVYLKYLSGETLTLLSRYYHVVSRRDAPRCVQEVLATRPPRLAQEYESPWGNEILGQLQLSPAREEDEYNEPPIYQRYVESASATPKMPRG